MLKQHKEKELISIILLIIATIFCAFMWEYIKIPYDTKEVVYGDSYSKNSYNSFNDTLRFILFISFPLGIFFLSKIFLEKKKIRKDILFKNFKFKNKTSIDATKPFYIFFLVVILIEFLLIDFSKLNFEIDIFHEGLWLTASSNLKIKQEIFNSSYVGRGLYGNFHPYILWEILGFQSIGITRIIGFFSNLLIKFISLILIKKISSSINLEKNEEIIFFVLLSLIFLNLTPYGDPVLYDRVLIIFIFTLLVFNFFFNNNKLYTLFFAGTFSSLSMLWYIDIGAYINFFLIILFIFFTLRKNFNYISILFLGIIFSWFLVFLFLPSNELVSFFHNTKMIYYTIDKIHGLIYPTPFFSGNARATKALLLFILSGVFIINLFFNNEEKTKNLLLVIIVFFIFSILLFKYGLSRSDGGHIKIASGLILITFFLNVIYYFVTFCGKFIRKKKNYNTQMHLIFLILIFTTFLYLFIEKKYESKSLKNINSFYSSITKVITLEDKIFLNNNYLLLVDFYKNLTKKDECVYIFTNEISLPYFLKKPTCSKNFINYISSPIKIQKEIINDLKSKKPEYILYKSDIDLYNDTHLRLRYVNAFIVENYKKYKKFLYWEIYKIVE